jgi:hypothetical protein
VAARRASLSVQEANQNNVNEAGEAARVDAATVRTWQSELLSHLQMDFGQLGLGEGRSIGYTYKCMGAGFAGLRFLMEGEAELAEGRRREENVGETMRESDDCANPRIADQHTKSSDARGEAQRPSQHLATDPDELCREDSLRWLFMEALRRLVLCAGDADTNAAVAGALMGCYVGYSALPSEYLHKMPHFDWLMAKVDALCTRLGYTALNYHD